MTNHMTKGKRTKSSVASHSQARAAGRCGIAERGGWVDQRVSEILSQSSLSFEEKTRLVYELLAAKPPVGDHLPPIDAIRIRLSRMFPGLAEAPDGPLAPQNMHGTVYPILVGALRSWKAINGHKRRRDGCASFITYLTNSLKWFCQHQLKRARERSREIPLSMLLRQDWGDQDDIEEDYVWSLGSTINAENQL
jgi:hypothetical protein